MLGQLVLAMEELLMSEILPATELIQFHWPFELFSLLLSFNYREPQCNSEHHKPLVSRHVFSVAIKTRYTP